MSLHAVLLAQHPTAPGLCQVLRSTAHSSEILPALLTLTLSDGQSDLAAYYALLTLTDLASLTDLAAELKEECADCRTLLAGGVPPSLWQIPTLATLLPEDLLGDLWDCLTADHAPTELRQLLTLIYTQTPTDWATAVFPLLFYTRDPAGLNRRQTFKIFLQEVYRLDPAGTRAVLPDIPRVGCWRDVYQLLRDPNLPPPLFQDLLDLAVQALRTARVGAKVVDYAPRENKHRVLAGILARALYPAERLYSTRMKLYRNCLADLSGDSKSVDSKSGDSKSGDSKVKLNSAAAPFCPGLIKT
jgi:hypothetical protein